MTPPWVQLKPELPFCTEHPGRENHCRSGACGRCWLCRENPDSAACQREAIRDQIAFHPWLQPDRETVRRYMAAEEEDACGARAEIARLRAALKRIAEFDMTPLGKLAREALGPAREETT